jgi:Large polyvalent protein associated domain 29
MITYNAKETAILIREKLKNSFPNQRFSVRSSERRVDISWTNGASAQDVQAIVGKFGGIQFDGVRTIYLESNYDGNIVNFRIQSPFLRRSYTEDFAAKIFAKVSEIEPKLMIDFLNGDLICQNNPHSREAKIWANFINQVNESDINLRIAKTLDSKIMPVSIEWSDRQGFGIFPPLNERNCLDEYICQEQPTPTAVKIIEQIQLTNDDYDRFINNLLDRYDWLMNKGGSDSSIKDDCEEAQHGFYYLVIEIWADDRAPVFINPDGRNFALSVGFPFHLDLRIPAPVPPDKHDFLKSKIVNMYTDWVAREMASGKKDKIPTYRDWLKNKTPDLYKNWVRCHIAADKLDLIITLSEWEKMYA